MTINRILFLLFCWCCMLQSQAIQFSFKHYQVENGLSENSVLCMLQDSKGFMWFGTKDGLNRFDGKSFVGYHNLPGDNSSIGNNYIRSLYEDQNKMLWVGTENGIYLYAPNQNKFTHFEVNTADNTPVKGAVNSIVNDNRGNIWISTYGHGLFRYNTIAKKLFRYNYNAQNRNALQSDRIWTLFCDVKGTVWVGTHNGGLARYNATTDNFSTIRFTSTNQSNDNCILRIYEDSQGNLLVGTINEGLIVLDRKSGKFENLLMEVNGERIYYIRDIYEYSPGVFLLGSEHGLTYMERFKGKLIQVKSSSSNPNALSDNSIYCISKDKEGGIWLGTYFGGVNYISPIYNPFEHYSPSEYENSISGKAVSQFCEDPEGNLWIGTEDGGLNYFDVHQNSFRSYKHHPGQNSLSYHNIHALMLNGDQLWIGTFTGGLNVLDIKTGKFKNYVSTSDKNSLCDNNVFSIYKDLTGTVWLGTINGLNRYNPLNDNFEYIPQPGRNTHIYDILQDHTGLIWFATYGNGLFCYDPRLKTWTHYLNNPGNSHSIPHNKIISIYQDEKKRLWFGTEGGGFCKYSYENKTFTTYNVKNGLPNNVVYMIIFEHDHLWLSTNKGLVRFNPDNESIKKFTKADGLQSDQFNFKSGYKARNGKIYFGGVNGFNVFSPDRLSENKFVPPVIFTNIQLFNKNITIGESGSPLKQAIGNTSEIVLNHNQSFVSFEFAALSYAVPEKNQYAYKLGGLDKEWNYIGNQNKISYTNLPPGKYTLHIKASNNDGLWNEEGTKLIIKIRPPFWRSIPAIIFYLLLLSVSAYFIMKNVRERNRKKEQDKLEKLHLETEKELYNAKLDFFTNIAHEIRTPLSLISAPLEYVMKIVTDKDGIKDHLLVIQSNTQRLLTLVNQLLDFRKAEKNLYPVSFRETNLSELLRNIYLRFEYSAKSKGLSLSLEIPDENFFATVDAESVTKIISNLLTNALKHANSQIVLSLSPGNDSFTIAVCNDGKGIPESEYERIFEPFYQIRENGKQTRGTGIGLALVKLLVEIHGGRITIGSVPENNTTFTVTLPVKKDLTPGIEPTMPVIGEVIDQYIRKTEIKETDIPTNDNLPSILIAEDNEELNHFLVQYFKDNYTVFSAQNGKEAVQILEKYPTDIIISDIVMPEMDGMELCQFVKTNMQYSHIPLVLLTAKTSLQSKIEGLEYGADAYIEKPFSIEHLSAQIFNLLESREKLKAGFINSPLTSIRSIGKNKADEGFLTQITEIIEKNMPNIDFSVDDLAQQLAMSRSSLHRKIKGISGLAPSDFIRLVRLKKAVSLMMEGETRINEICYLVGFNTPSYFSKCFQKQFGLLPKDFIKKQLNT